MITRAWGEGAGLAGKGLVVTGAASGIGRAMALEAAAAGIDVVLVDRAAQPEEIARDGLFLLSDHASYVAGVILGVDGGWLRR